MAEDFVEFKNFKGVGFEIENIYYIYDSYSNQILRAEKIMLDIIDDSFILEENQIVNKYKVIYNEEMIKNCLSSIKMAQDSADILKNFKIPGLAISKKLCTREKVEKKLSDELMHLMFNVTEDCNFRCLYCVYSGCYNNRRSHTKGNIISWDVGKKAIEFFLEHSRNVKKRYITFYGGEPLLNFNFIEMAINHTKRLDPEVRFSITTNGSLLNETILDYLTQQNLTMQISLDGPDQIHDLFRKTVSNHKTYEIAMEKLELIKQKYPDFYKNNLSINAVLVPHNFDLDTINNFFSNKNRFPFIKGDQNFSLGTVNPMDNTFVKEYDYNPFLWKFRRRMAELYKQYHLKSLDLAGIEAPVAIFHKYMKYLAIRSNKRLSEYDFYWPTGICIPGMRSMFVAWNGDIYPCEKLYDYEDMCIGHIDKGFFIDKIVEYIDEYAELTLPYCRDCWNYRLCGYCFLTSRFNNSFDMKRRMEYCAALRKTMLEHLKMYITIHEKNEKAFDYLKEDGDGKAIFVDQMLDD
ncbi:MAG: radical SAM protein [Candidatus Aminicenantes bacterium]|nr:radical SAM protein [Candidatus Aminicenantes bacterium]